MHSFRSSLTTRHSFIQLVLCLAFLMLLVVSSSLSAGASKAENFVLLDQHGDAHELHYLRDASAVVLIVHGNGCQIVSSNLSAYKQLRADYASKGVETLMLNSNLQDNRASIAEDAEEWAIDLPILDDRSQIVGRALELNRTGEVLVIDPRDWRIVYRGPIDDRVDYERQKNEASKHYVRDALDALIAGKDVAARQVNSPGCIINYDDANTQQISYSETIAPLLIDKCVACHVQGGIAPWAMSEYNMVKGFAPMMREVIRTKRMPPWHADPDVGHWSNDVGLSDQETRSLIDWIEAGAPRGEGDDPLTKIPALNNEWALGEPDLILDIPAFEVPANGVVEYQFPTIANPLDKDVWVIAAAILPGDTKVVHHILAGSSEKTFEGEGEESIFENFIMGYAPGNEAFSMPEGTGVFVPKGGVYKFQLHYTPYGKATVDKSKMGLYFSETPPDNFYRQHVILNPALAIPPNAERHEEKAYFDFSNNATIHALTPHAHYRGRSSEFELQYPDGTKEMILSVPNYDFNWQRTYVLTESKKVPAGTRMMHRTIYDNSTKNKSNPDPQEQVRWGLQSAQEMLYGSIGYYWTDETTAKPIHDSLLNEASMMVGFMDQDMDGVASKAEMPKRMVANIGESWAQLDRDADGGLNVTEMLMMLRSQQQSEVTGGE